MYVSIRLWELYVYRRKQVFVYVFPHIENEFKVDNKKVRELNILSGNLEKSKYDIEIYS